MEKEIQHDHDIYNKDEEMIFNPYNPFNKEISQKEIETLLKKYGINTQIFNFNLYKRSFVHKSYVKRPHLENVGNNIIIEKKPHDCLPLRTKSNERLEFLGDGVLELITKYYLYRRFPKENEGFMTEKKIALVKNEAIGKLAYEMGLNKWYILSKNAEEKKTRTNLKKLGMPYLKLFLVHYFWILIKLKFLMKKNGLMISLQLVLDFKWHKFL